MASTPTALSTPAIRQIDLRAQAQRSLAEGYIAVREAAGRFELGEDYQRYTLTEARVDADPTLAAHRCEHLVAVESGRVIGGAEVFFPLRDNLTNSFGQVVVAPEHRRRGVGTALLEELTRRVRAAGREILTITGERASGGPESDIGSRSAGGGGWCERLAGSGTSERQRASGSPRAGTPAASLFAQRHGFTAALGAQHSVLRLPDGASGLDTLLGPIEAEVARAEAVERYHLVSYLDAVPRQWIDQRAVLAGRMSTDAPLDDLELSPELWDADRVREKDQMMLDQGRRAVETVTVHRGTGVMAGATTVVYSPEHGDIAYQWDTLVLAEHRGHRLGMWLKAANLRVLLEAFPAVRRVSTYNAQSNGPMLRVNRAFGFEEVGVQVEWQKRL